MSDLDELDIYVPMYPKDATPEHRKRWLLAMTTTLSKVWQEIGKEANAPLADIAVAAAASAGLCVGTALVIDKDAPDYQHRFDAYQKQFEDARAAILVVEGAPSHTTN